MIKNRNSERKRKKCPSKFYSAGNFCFIGGRRKNNISCILHSLVVNSSYLGKYKQTKYN